ncbi:hypothetical protein NEMIN01_2403 [Nematocida minor]|uniref:uncharacterized protein n=1 Tax=Nematocida minor TaxID=1912983 RepID=UPI00221FB00E|nr:uncharacterized protein NEMIN01_2403 [Nematocida minor]KAI5193195.1 hypothetical protein NEMIN01_2403 [Nematocida minor]
MIIQRTLKQIVVGVAALAYFQRAACELLVGDLQHMTYYWKRKIDFMQRELRIRDKFLNEVKNFKITSSEVRKQYIQIRKEDLLRINRIFNNFEISAKNVIDKAEKLVNSAVSQLPEQKVENQGRAIEGLVLQAFHDIDSLNNQIKKYDSYMLEVIKVQSSKEKNSNKKVQDLTLYKLAMCNKPFALYIIYTLFRAQPYEQGADIKDAVTNMHFKEYFHHHTGFSANFTDYTSAISNDVKKGGLDLLALADKHLPILFNTAEGSAGVVDIYLILAQKEISEDAMAQCKNITPGQVVKVIMIECIITGARMDYRRNWLFFNLEKIIKNIGRPANKEKYSDQIQILKSKQNMILDALCLLWIEPKIYKVITQGDISLFCRNNHIKIDNLLALQGLFTSVRWMYRMEVAMPSKEAALRDPTLLEKIYFDMFYIHPMAYLYQRYKDLCSFTKAGIKSDARPFAEKASDKITLMLYKVKENSVLANTENIKDCIRAWFIKHIKIAYREEDDKQYYNIVIDFMDYLSKSTYMDTKAPILNDPKREKCRL